MASGADEAGVAHFVVQRLWESLPFNCELHFITNLVPQPRLSLRLLTRTCIK
jgi:hypothetical protein